MKFRYHVLALAASLGLAFTANAQTYAVGQATCSPGGTISCVAIPLNAGGQPTANVWWYENSTYNTHWLKFGEGLTALGQATISMDASYHTTTAQVTNNGHTAILPTSSTFTYYGTVNGSAYNGMMTLVFDWYYVSTCSGRGCGGTLGWHRRIIGGSTTYAVADY